MKESKAEDAFLGLLWLHRCVNHIRLLWFLVHESLVDLPIFGGQFVSRITSFILVIANNDAPATWVECNIGVLYSDYQLFPIKSLLA